MGIVSYAQNFEDVMLWHAPAHVQDGFCLDIGAQHPVVDSVSKAFYDQGWRGIHVEPCVEYVQLLRADRPDEVVLQAVEADQPGMVRFYAIPGTGLSTAIADIAEQHRAQLHCAVIPVHLPSVTLDEIVGLVDRSEIHWMKIDAAGFEGEVVAGWRSSPRRPWIIVVEALHPNTHLDVSRNWESMILSKGYKLVHEDGVNRFYLSELHSYLQENFRFPANVLDGFQFSGTATALTRNLVSQFEQERDELIQQRFAAEAELTSLRDHRDTHCAEADRREGEVRSVRGELDATKGEAGRIEERLAEEKRLRGEGAAAKTGRWQAAGAIGLPRQGT